jgi:hypothetical protein
MQRARRGETVAPDESRATIDDSTLAALAVSGAETKERAEADAFELLGVRRPWRSKHEYELRAPGTVWTSQTGSGHRDIDGIKVYVRVRK